MVDPRQLIQEQAKQAFLNSNKYFPTGAGLNL